MPCNMAVDVVACREFREPTVRPQLPKLIRSAKPYLVNSLKLLFRSSSCLSPTRASVSRAVFMRHHPCAGSGAVASRQSCLAD